MTLTKVQFHVTHVGNQLSVFQASGKVRKQLGHLSGTFYVIGVVFHAKAFFIVDGGAGLDADINVLKR